MHAQVALADTLFEWDSLLAASPKITDRRGAGLWPLVPTQRHV